MRKKYNLIKTFQQYSHVHHKDMKMFIYDNRLGSAAMDKACEKVYNAGAICKLTRRQSIEVNILLTHIIEKINEKLQADFVTVFTRAQKYKVLNIVDVRTTLGENNITSIRSVNNVINLFKVSWIRRNGASKSFSAEPSI